MSNIARFYSQNEVMFRNWVRNGERYSIKPHLMIENIAEIISQYAIYTTHLAHNY